MLFANCCFFSHLSAHIATALAGLLWLVGEGRAVKPVLPHELCFFEVDSLTSKFLGTEKNMFKICIFA